MKKLFTFAAAVLASVAMMADDVVLFSTDFSSADWSEVTTICSQANSENEVINGITFRSYASPAKPYTVDNAAGTLTFCNNNSGNNYFMAIPVQNVNGKVIVTIGTVSNSQRVNYLFRETNEIVASSVSMTSTAASINTNSSITIEYEMKGTGDEALVMLGRQGSGQATVIKTITISTPQAEAITDPVGQVSISGAAECFVGRKVALTATVDVKANAYKWSVDGVDVEGAASSVFEFTPAAEGTFSIIAYAKNDNNSDWVASAAHEVVATIKPVVEQVAVSETTVWDWTKAASVTSIQWEGDAKDAAPVLLANVDNMNNDENFNSQALLFSGEYPVRDGKYCQGQSLAFTTTVAGTLEVVYCNTGNRSSDEDKRILTVNGTKYGEGAQRSDTDVTESNIPIEAGDVVLGSVLKKDDSAQYIRIKKVTFTKGGDETAIDNTEAAVKAVKVVRNGQLFIEKNGVLYNAQGAIVK